jgi:hypothetical protein
LAETDGVAAETWRAIWTLLDVAELALEWPPLHPVSNIRRAMRATTGGLTESRD